MSYPSIFQVNYQPQGDLGHKVELATVTNTDAASPKSLITVKHSNEGQSSQRSSVTVANLTLST